MDPDVFFLLVFSFSRYISGPAWMLWRPLGPRSNVYLVLSVSGSRKGQNFWIRNNTELPGGATYGRQSGEVLGAP